MFLSIDLWKLQLEMWEEIRIAVEQKVIPL